MPTALSGNILNLLPQAEWIGGAGNTFCRNVFGLGSKPVSAVVYIVADPHAYVFNYDMGESSFLKYRIFVNGIQVGAGPARPINDGRPVLHRFDVQEMLLPGRNTIGVISRGEQKGFALVLHVESSGGEQINIFSGTEWRQLDANNIYRPVCWECQALRGNKGNPGPGEWPENIDGRIFPFGWLTADYDDGNWSRAVSFGRLDGNDFDVYNSLNYNLSQVLPQVIKKLEPGHFFIDFGHEVVAGIELDCPPGGGAVEVRLGEEVMEADKVRFRMRTANHYQELWQFKAGGGALSHFGERAFRYAEIVGWNGELAPENIRAVTLNMPFEGGDSALQCSNANLVRVWQFCKDTIAWTTQDIYNDCPSRERTAYEADSYINMLTHFGVESNTATARRTLEYLLKHPTWPCEYRQIMIPLFYEYMMHTGDCEFVARHYRILRDKYSYHRLLRNGLVPEFPERVIVDWPPFYRADYDFGTDNAVPNAFVYWDLILLAKLAKIFNDSAAQAEFDSLAAEVKEAFNRRLFDGAQGLYRDNAHTSRCSFHASMFALSLDLVPEDRVAGVLDFIKRRGMACGVYPAQFYLDALFKHGQAEFAVKLMTSEGDRSWLEMMRLGATTTTEAWNPFTDKANTSWAHPWATAPGNVIPRRLFGLSPVEPGWSKIAFKPQPGGLAWGRITIPTPRGRLTASFRRQDDGGYLNDMKGPVL